jgi:hypothetical protein
MSILHTIPIRVRGRFKAVKHTGHKYDDHGNIVEFGKVLEETSFGNNTITKTGFNKMLGATPAVGGGGTSGELVFVAGTGNTAPAESQSTLVSYAGKTNTHVSTTTTRNVTPDVNGDVWWRTTYRVTFNPGSLGSGAVNIAEFGVVMGTAIGSVTGSTPIGARGLPVDGGGDPTTVSLDASTEYLDAIWEYTEWIPASVTGSVNLTIDGDVIAHDYEVRPIWFDNTGGSFNNRGWKNASALSGWTFQAVLSVGVYDATNSNTVAYEGPLAAITGANPGGTYNASNMPSAMVMAAYTTDSKLRDVELVWTPAYGNIDIGVVRVHLGHTQWQVSYDPVIEKIDTKQLKLTFRFAMANKE